MIDRPIGVLGDNLWGSDELWYNAEVADGYMDAQEAEVARLRELVAGQDDGGHWYSQQTMDAMVGERDKLRDEIAQLREHCERLMRASRQLLNDSRQQPRDYAREAIARYLDDYPEVDR